MLPLLQLLLPEVTAHHRVAVLVDALGEVLAGHADHAAFPVLQDAVIDEIPLLHHPSLQVHRYYLCFSGFANGEGATNFKPTLFATCFATW